jgi:hypothetical protein
LVAGVAESDTAGVAVAGPRDSNAAKVASSCGGGGGTSAKAANQDACAGTAASMVGADSVVRIAEANASANCAPVLKRPAGATARARVNAASKDELSDNESSFARAEAAVRSASTSHRQADGSTALAWHERQYEREETGREDIRGSRHGGLGFHLLGREPGHGLAVVFRLGNRPSHEAHTEVCDPHVARRRRPHEQVGRFQRKVRDATRVREVEHFAQVAHERHHFGRRERTQIHEIGQRGVHAEVGHRVRSLRRRIFAALDDVHDEMGGESLDDRFVARHLAHDVGERFDFGVVELERDVAVRSGDGVVGGGHAPVMQERLNGVLAGDDVTDGELGRAHGAFFEFVVASAATCAIE